MSKLSRNELKKAQELILAVVNRHGLVQVVTSGRAHGCVPEVPIFGLFENKKRRLG